MTRSFITRVRPPTFLSPGQTFHANDVLSSRGSKRVTVTRLVRDDHGLMHAVLRDDDGREISAFVEQVEFAIELGNLRPMDHDLGGIAC